MKRFWEKVDKTETCWLWLSSLNNRGYGQFHVGRRGAHVLAHRFAWEMERGPIPAGLELDHLCRVPHCVRPDHLEAVTHKVNMSRGVFPSWHETHCIHGHEFTPANTHVYQKNGYACRQCRTCHRQRTALYRQKGRTT